MKKGIKLVLAVQTLNHYACTLYKVLIHPNQKAKVFKKRYNLIALMELKTISNKLQTFTVIYNFLCYATVFSQLPK